MGRHSRSLPFNHDSQHVAFVPGHPLIGGRQFRRANGVRNQAVDADASARDPLQRLFEQGLAGRLRSRGPVRQHDFVRANQRRALPVNQFVEVKFKSIAGKEDQAGGLIWRFKDGDNYYIARANALEDNVTIYHTVKGNRSSFKSLNTKVSTNEWHTLRVDFSGDKFKVSFDGAVVIEADDTTFRDAGAVGVWTKADSVTLFDDFKYEGK